MATSPEATSEAAGAAAAMVVAAATVVAPEATEASAGWTAAALPRRRRRAPAAWSAAPGWCLGNVRHAGGTVAATVAATPAARRPAGVRSEHTVPGAARGFAGLSLTDDGPADGSRATTDLRDTAWRD